MGGIRGQQPAHQHPSYTLQDYARTQSQLGLDLVPWDKPKWLLRAWRSGLTTVQRLSQPPPPLLRGVSGAPPGLIHTLACQLACLHAAVPLSMTHPRVRPEQIVAVGTALSASSSAHAHEPRVEPWPPSSEKTGGGLHRHWADTAMAVMGHYTAAKWSPLRRLLHRRLSAYSAKKAL